MAAFKVNGKNVCSEKNQKLLRFLRDELRLTSVKDGCSEGACGACTVIIDGKTCKACVPDTDSLSGREIITVEGLTEWERQVYTYAYGKAGAVQCGFCIPGMVMCTKALLDENMEPMDDEIRYALKRLVKGRVLTKGRFNESRFDRTNWYAFTEFGQFIMAESEAKTQ